MPLCQHEVPRMQELFTRFQNRGLQVLGLTEMRLSTTPEKVRAYIDRRDLTYPIAGAAPETSRAPVFTASPVMP